MLYQFCLTFTFLIAIQLLRKFLFLNYYTSFAQLL